MSYPIPDAALERHIGILGKTGSGKSNTAKTAAELIMFRGGRVCVIDPTGTWWGVRLDRDGKKPSRFKPVIFGGNHADIPIAGEHGAAIGEAIATASSSAIIDTRLLTVGARTRFFTAFAEALLRFNKGPLHLIIDEAHLFAPQGRVNDPASGQMLHAANNLVSLGRGIGLRIMLISQRPAKLHKDSITQVETLIAMRLIAPQDRKAIDDWVGEWADPGKGKEITASLPSMPTGEGWIWSPEIDLLTKAKFPLAATFDSGVPSAQQQLLDPINVDDMGAKLEAIRADVVANDPTRLKAEVARLKKELATNQTAKSNVVDPKAIEAARQTGYDSGFDDGSKVGWNAANLKLKEALAARRGAVDEALSRVFDLELPYHSIVADTKQRSAPATLPAKHLKREGTFVPKTQASGDLGAERKPLALLVGAYPAGYTEAQWASLAGFKRTGGTWGTYKSRLRTKGLVEERGGLWYATDAGVEANGGEAPSVPTTPEGRLDMWKSKISGVGPMLDVLFRTYPSAIDRYQLATELEMAAGGGTFGTYLSRLRSNGLIETSGGAIRLTPAIMGDA